VSWLGGWAPGGAGSDFPPGTGLPTEPGSKIVLQIHYNTLDADGQPDQSSILFKLDDTVDRPARILPWTNPYWIIQDSMDIPAGETDVTHSFEYDPTTVNILGLDGDPIRIYSAALHMHNLGKSGRLSIERSSGESECLLSIPNYDFHWQRSYGLMESVLVHPGDTLRLECHWDNSQANQLMVDGKLLPVQNVSWGQGTTDEMCLGIFYITVED
jgi:hypothetical protein